MAATATWIIDLLLPERCAACGLEEAAVCAACLAALTRLYGPLCARCGTPTAWPVDRCGDCAGRRLPFATARSAVAYEGPAPILVSAWKERGLRRLVRALADVVVEVVPRPPVEAVAFVAGDPERSRWRGQNPAEALARALAHRWELEVAPVLTRTAGPRQRGLSRRERRANVRASFRGVGGLPARIALADDVYTTGATACAAASALRGAGARAVHVVTFARAVRRH